MKCKYCGNEHDGSYGSGQFCSESCARNYSQSFIDRSKTKEAVCIKCGKIININCNAPQKYAMCDECKKHSEERKCTICGSILKKGEKCQNEFCKMMHNRGCFKTLIKYFGYDETKLGTPDAETEYYRIRDYIYDLYWNKNESSLSIAKMFGYT